MSNERMTTSKPRGINLPSRTLVFKTQSKLTKTTTWKVERLKVIRKRAKLKKRSQTMKRNSQTLK